MNYNLKLEYFPQDGKLQCRATMNNPSRKVMEKEIDAALELALLTGSKVEETAEHCTYQIEVPDELDLEILNRYLFNPIRKHINSSVPMH